MPHSTMPAASAHFLDPATARRTIWETHLTGFA